MSRSHGSRARFCIAHICFVQPVRCIFSLMKVEKGRGTKNDKYTLYSFYRYVLLIFLVILLQK